MWVISLWTNASQRFAGRGDGFVDKRFAAALIALSLSALALIAALVRLTWLCGLEGYDRLLMAKGVSAEGIDIWRVEDFCRDEFLVTYEIEGRSVAEIHNYRSQVKLIGTNGYYAQIMSYRLLSGGFFSAAAWRAGSREAVLNAAAAFQLYGSEDVTGQQLRMDGAFWLIAGVLDDGGADDPRIYVPASVAGGTAGSLMALLDGHSVNADYARGSLKQLGVYDGAYTVVDLPAAAAAFSQRLTVSLLAALILIILLLLRRWAGLLLGRLPRYREQMKRLYPRELLAANRADLAKAALTGLAMLGGLAAMVVSALRILAICLCWPRLLPAGHDWAMGGFAGKLAWLHAWFGPGAALFILLLLVLTAIFVLVWKLSAPKPQETEIGGDHG